MRRIVFSHPLGRPDAATMETANIEPYVRVVVLNFDGGAMTLECLESLFRVDWPVDRFEVVMVDNGSVDGIVDDVRRLYPLVRIVEPFANLGFAAGCNTGIRHPGHWDFVALVNNDATVAKGWLRPLVEGLQQDSHIGAASSKMLFDGSFVGVEIVTETDEPDMRARAKTIRLTGATDATGADLAGSAVFDEGFGINLHETRTDRWAKPQAEIRWRADKPACPRFVRLQLSSPEQRAAQLRTPNSLLDVTLGPEPEWFDVVLDHPPFDVINNAGSNLFTGGRGGDRGFLERDGGQFERPADVFAWCGGAVLLRKEYLDAVGLFDERFFLYYEDTDLSWRGRLQGWKYVYMPESVVRHRHAASSGGQQSQLFRFFVQRNRLLMLVRSAPMKLVVRAVGGDVLRVGWAVRSSIAPVKFGRRPNFSGLFEQVRALLSFTKVAPRVFWDRLRDKPKVDRASLLQWMVTK
jgi:GT2 family glycosyltransferase